jgi:DNA-binding MarR family transcriptional regulator
VAIDEPLDAGTSKPPNDISKADYEALSTYRYAMRRFLRFSEEAAKLAGISAEQYLLLAIKGYPGREQATAAELAERLQLDYYATAVLITKCQKEGYVKRQRGEHDDKQEYLTLTASGAQRLSLLARVHREQLRRMRDDLRPPGFTTG